MRSLPLQTEYSGHTTSSRRPEIVLHKWNFKFGTRIVDTVNFQLERLEMRWKGLAGHQLYRVTHTANKRHSFSATFQLHVFVCSDLYFLCPRSADITFSPCPSRCPSWYLSRAYIDLPAGSATMAVGQHAVCAAESLPLPTVDSSAGGECIPVKVE